MAGILNQLGVGSMTGVGTNGAPMDTTASLMAPNGVKASNPYQKVSTPSTTITPSYQAPQANSQASIQTAAKANPSSFDFLAGESPQAYNSRIAALVSGQGSGQTGGAGGGQSGAPQANNSSLTFPVASGTGASQPNPQPTASPAPTNAGILNQLIGNAGNTQFSQDNANLQNLKNEQATLEQNIAGGDQPLYFKQGEMGQEQQAYQTKLAAASQATQNDIAEQGATTTALGDAASATLPANQNYAVPQGQEVINAQGQQVAAGPQLGAPGQAYYTPGQTNTSGGGAPATAPAGYTQSAWNQYIQDYASGNFGAIPSDVTGNVNISGQLQAAVQSQNPGFSYNSALGAGQGAQTVASNQGTITAGQNTQIANYKSAQQQGKNLASQASDLINQFKLNPSDLNAANGAIQKIALNTSNPQYQILNNYLNDISARYAQILTPPGGASTDTTRAVATGMLNSLASGTSLQTVLNALDQQANAVIAGVPTTGGSGTSATPSAAPAGTSGGSSANPWH